MAELNINRCERFILVDIEKIKEEHHGVFGQRRHIKITDILAKARYMEESKYSSVAKTKQICHGVMRDELGGVG